MPYEEGQQKLPATLLDMPSSPVQNHHLSTLQSILDPDPAPTDHLRRRYA